MSAVTLLTRRRRRVLTAAGLLAAAALPGAARLETDNAPRVFFPRGAPEVARYREFLRTFGAGEAVRLVVGGEGLWTGPGLAWLGRLEEEAGKVPGVASARGLWGHHRRGLPAWPPPDPGAFRQRVREDPLDRALGWVGRGGELATVLVSLEPGAAGALGALEGLLADPPSGVTARVAGLPVLNRALDGSTDEIERRFFPLLVLLAAGLLAAVFRSVRAVAYPLLFVAASEVLILGAMGYAGVELNLVLAVLPPLIFAIALATAVHLVVAFRERRSRGEGGPEAVAETYRDKGWAVLWTGVTTMVGFGSLAASEVGPVRDLGIWSAAGIAAMTAAAFLLLPALLAGGAGVGGEGGRPFEGWMERRGRRWARGAVRRRGWVLAGAGLLALLAAAGLPRLGVESNALRYLEPHHPVRATIEGLEERGIGSAALEVVLELPAGRTFRSAEGLAGLAAVAAEIRGQDLVLGAVGAADLADDLARGLPAGALGGAGAARPLILEGMARDPEGREILSSFLDEGGRRARMLVFTRTVGFRELEPLLERIRRAGEGAFPGLAGLDITGEYRLLLLSQRRLLATLGASLGITLAAVGAIFRLLLGSFRIAFLALLPNAWPVLGVLGAMGWLGIPLDIATVMVASVVLGLAVDDTIHTMGHFRELAPRLGRLEAVAGTLERTAPAYLLTGAILALGFGVCALSSFAPLHRFGILSALAVALAVLGDLFLIPALLGSAPAAVLGRLGRGARGGLGGGAGGG